jgi:hypothetical protein
MKSSHGIRLGASVLLTLMLTLGLAAGAFGVSPANPGPAHGASQTVSATTPKTSPKPAECLPSGRNPKVRWPDCLRPAGTSTKSAGGQAHPAVATVALSGTVSDTGGPLDNIEVDAFSADNTDFTNTDASGNYSFDLPPGDYIVFVFDGSNTYLHGYYDSGAGSGHFTTVEGSATPVTVAAVPVTGIDMTMQTGNYISGTVTDSSSAPLGDITVTAHSSNYDGDTVTDASGNYSVLVPPSDSYTVFFADPTNTYLHGYYDSGAVSGHFTTALGSAELVPISLVDVTGINVTIPAGNYISGTVTDSGSAPLGDITVTAHSSNYDSDTVTDASGNYSVLVPASDSYVVSFSDLTGTYLLGYYDSSATGNFTTDLGSAELVPVSGDVIGIDVQMELAPPWSVTLAASATPVTAGTPVTLTATSNKDVGPTFYFIVILASDDSVVDVCGGGLTCHTPVTRATAGSETFHAVIGYSDGTSPIASSSPLTVTWTPKTNTYHPLAPVRLLDTRFANGLSGKLVAATPRTFLVATRGGVPAGATAVTANVTVVNSSAASSVYLGPDPISHPATSTINFNKNDITAYGSTIALNASGHMSATYMAGSGTTDLVMDVTGYFTANTSGDTYHPLTPARLVDTRVKNGLTKGKLVANVPQTFTVKGRGGVPSNAKAVTGNVTVTGSNNGWALYIGPTAIAKPSASTINFVKGQTRANSLTVALSPGGTLSATFMSSAGKTTDLVFDVTGYYTADLTGAKYVPITPTRLLDTRTSVGLSGKFTANTPRTLAVRGHAGVPSNATGITGIVSIYNQTNSWAVFVGPTAIVKPTTSAINFVKGDNCANGLTVALSPGGNLSATYMGGAGNTTNIVIIVTGYFVP